MPRIPAALALAASLAFGALAACAPNAAEHEPELLVGVAASLRPVAEALAEQFKTESGANVTLVTGSSGALAEQLRQGAPLDLILSADARRAAALDADGLLAPGSVRHLATGELVAVTTIRSADRGANAAASLIRGGRVRRIAIANPELAPYGEAARRYLHDAGLWDAAEPLAVYGASVAQALQYAVSGAAELGFVARSLLIASGDSLNGAAAPGAAPDPSGAGANAEGLRVLPPLPRNASAELRVTVGISATSTNAKRAGEFAAFLSAPARAEAWTRFGYAPG